MTFTQINYFLTLAKCLNFTEASEKLYISQPALSRQIKVIESELNMLLFIRSNKSLRLTPAGIVLRNKLSNYFEEYNAILEEANRANYGVTGVLQLGIIEGHDVNKFLHDLLQYFDKNFPYVKIYLERCSFHQLIENINDKNLDVAITYEFDVKYRKELQYQKIQICKACLIVSNDNELSKKQSVSIKDMKNETFVIVTPKDCKNGVEYIISEVQKYGGFYPNLKYVDKMSDAMLWIESGMYSALLNDGVAVYPSSQVSYVPIKEASPVNVVAAWNVNNTNPSILLLQKYIVNLCSL